MQPKIIYKDQDLLIINKPAGLLVHNPKLNNPKLDLLVSGQNLTLVDWLIKNYPEIKKVGDQPKIRPGIVHRLDKDTSGVLIIARNQKSFEYLKKLFQEKKIKKTYLMLIWGKISPKTGLIKKPIGLKAGSIKRTVITKKAKMVKEAITAYKVIKFLKLGNWQFSLVEAEPFTGRTHQIRLHFNSINHPVVGDKLYGRKIMPEGLKRQFLHAESVEFDLPKGGRIKAEADLPPDLTSFLKLLGEEDPQHNT